ncbi:MAG: hypothetical protein LRY71_01900 [Bacillaceae bacterium]|nr:hypothetical protein [Bacillaceae bacterium]
MAEAKAEYKEYKKHGKSTVHLYIKYIKKGKVLEKEIDDRFYTLLNRFKNDLLNHNSSMDSLLFTKITIKKQNKIISEQYIV